MKTPKPNNPKLVKMRETVLKEMDHIPRWPKDTQSDLRACYWLVRMNSLGKKATVANDRDVVLKRCLDLLAKDHPRVKFEYDKDFFQPH